MSVGVEHVLVVPTLLFHEVGYFQGFSTNPDPYLKLLLDPAHTSYRPRDEVEEDPSFKQLIPYCLFVCEGQIFHYARSSGQGEGRLHGKRSVGVGGHISSEDAERSSAVYQEGMRREIEEEIYLDPADLKSETQLVGLINDDETEVGRVHLGIVHLFELKQPSVRPKEATLLETGFSNPEDLVSELDQFETWSQICLKHLYLSNN